MTANTGAPGQCGAGVRSRRFVRWLHRRGLRRDGVQSALKQGQRRITAAQGDRAAGSSAPCWSWQLAVGTGHRHSRVVRGALSHCRSRSELAGRELQGHSQLYTQESWDRLWDAVEAALHAGTPYELDLEMVRPDGAHRWVRARGEAQRDAGNSVAGLRGTVQDITERKRAEEVLSSVNRRLLEAQESERPGLPETCTTTSVSASHCCRWGWDN